MTTTAELSFPQLVSTHEPFTAFSLTHPAEEGSDRPGVQPGSTQHSAGKQETAGNQTNQVTERSREDLEESSICKGSSAVPAMPQKANMTYITASEILCMVFLIGM